MPDITMLEAADYQEVDRATRAVAKQIVEESPVMEYAPVHTIRGSAFTYPREESLGTVDWRAVGGSYTANAGTIRHEVETLAEAGGEVFVDDQEVESSNLIDIKPHKYMMKSRAMGLFISEQFFEGDKSVNPIGLDGLRRRLTGNQLINAGTGGDTLTLVDIRNLIDSIAGGPDMFFMNKTMRNKITALVDAQTGTARIEYTQDTFGRQMRRFDGIPIRVVERQDDASTFLGFDEDDGAGNPDTCSIYAVKFGMDAVHLIAHGGVPTVKDFGEIESRPGHLGRIRWMWGLAIEHPRAAARLYHINNA